MVFNMALHNSECYKQGQDARQDGHPVRANPYRSSPKSVGFNSWKEGWHDKDAYISGPKDENGDTLIGQTVEGDFPPQKPFAETVNSRANSWLPKETPKPTGGNVNYYLCNVTHPKRDVAPYVAECEDLIEFMKLTFDEACEFKAIWRTASARLGVAKPNNDPVYDAEKRVHYATRSLRTEQRLAKAKADNSG